MTLAVNRARHALPVASQPMAFERLRHCNLGHVTRRHDYYGRGPAKHRVWTRWTHAGTGVTSVAGSTGNKSTSGNVSGSGHSTGAPPQYWYESGLEPGGESSFEARRVQPRAVFSFQRWSAHRSSSRYLRHFTGLFASRTFRSLLPPVGFLTATAVLAAWYNSDAVPRWGAPTINLGGDAVLEVTAFALSLLLVFRTDSSYARWEQALRAWNDVRYLAKDLARQVCYWVGDPERKAMTVRWCAAFSRALLAHVRPSADMRQELTGLLLPHEVAAVAAVGPCGAPSFVLQVMSELVEQCAVSEIKEDTMYSTIRQLGATLGACDMLLRYPLPLAYTRHTSRFMIIWLSALPFALWDTCGWGVVPLTSVVAYLLLGIDEIGVQIEEPFTSLPLEDMAADIEADIGAMMDRQDLVTDLLTASGVVCGPRSTFGACSTTAACQGESPGGSSSSAAVPRAAGGASSTSVVGQVWNDSVAVTGLGASWRLRAGYSSSAGFSSSTDDASSRSLDGSDMRSSDDFCNMD